MFCTPSRCLVVKRTDPRLALAVPALARAAKEAVLEVALAVTGTAISVEGATIATVQIALASPIT